MQHRPADHAFEIHHRPQAQNLPYVQFVAGVLIGIIMQGYVKIRRSSLRGGSSRSRRARSSPCSSCSGLFQTGQEWVAAAFYLLGLIFAILLVSQFWSLANAIYDPRQAKRLFGFIGGGTASGEQRGASPRWSPNTRHELAAPRKRRGLALCIVIVVLVLGRERHAVAGPGGEEAGRVSGRAKR